MTDCDEHEETPASVRADLAGALTWSARAGQATHIMGVLMSGAGDEDE